MNLEWSRKLLQSLSDQGVSTVIVCAGARNSPLVTMLAHTESLSKFSFFEERSAAFFAIGLARRLGQPVAVVTTSGTAAAELLPATVEAFHTGVPLILVTADRPRRLRGTGAPQSIDQTGLFAKFIAAEFDLESGEMPDFSQWGRRTPVHINICFDEPLIDAEPRDFTLAPAPAPAPVMGSFLGASRFATTAGADWSSLRLLKFLRSPGPLLVLVGTLESQEERNATATFLRKLGAPVYLESTSGLRENFDLFEIALRSGDKILNWALKQNLYARVLRIGGIPTARIWRDLDQRSTAVETLSISPLPFAGLSRGEAVCCELAPLFAQIEDVSTQSSTEGERILVKDREIEVQIRHLLELEPQSEPALVHRLSQLISPEALVYLGNSLPIREWDFISSRDHTRAVEANRGVNGIDGQVSTFFGLARADRENWAILGDLTALYDLQGVWALYVRRDLKAKIVVINNSGGKIFERIFGHALFENRHDLDFKGWAAMWRLGYQRWTEIPIKVDLEKNEIIEIVPGPAATKRFWDQYDSLWK